MRRALAILAIAVLPVAADDLPPWVLMLARIRSHVRESLDRLPDCTCLENIARFHRLAGKELRPVDTVVLQILFSGDKELFASPGDTHWDANIGSLLSAGMMGNGLFALHLRSIFLNNQSVITYHGMEDIAGRQEARYDFSISRMLSGYDVNTAGGSAVVGTRGSFWADPENFDLRRIEFHAEDIPPQLLVSEIYTAIDYERMHIGQSNVLLPQTAELRMTGIDGQQSRNQIEFTHCQGFHTESTLSFVADESPPAAAAPKPAAAVSSIEGTLPAGVRVSVALTRPIDEHTPVGALIEGKISGDVTEKKRLVLPARAVVRGRIRRLERRSDPFPYFLIAIEFTRIEEAGRDWRFYADLEQADQPFGLQISAGSLQVSSGVDAANPRATSTIKITSKPLPGVGTLFVRGSHFVLPAGFRTTWKTQTFPQSATR